MQDDQSNSGPSTGNACGMSGYFPTSCTMEEGFSDVIYEGNRASAITQQPDLCYEVREARILYGSAGESILHTYD